MKGLNSISFQRPLGDVLELNFVLYVLDLTKSLLSVPCLTELKCLTEFDGQQITITDSSHGSS